MSSLERNLGIFTTLQPLRSPNAPWAEGEMTGQAIAAGVLRICSLPAQARGVAEPIPGPQPGQGKRGDSTGSGSGAVARGQRKGEPDHNQSLDSHAGHGRDLAELVPIQPVKFIHLEQAVFHQAGEDEQKSCKTEIETTFYFVALNA